MELEERDLGEKGRAYVIDLLQHGLAFGQAVARQPWIHTASATTLLPKDIVLRDDHNFRHSAGQFDYTDARSILIDKIQNYVGNDRQRLVITEDCLSLKGDGWLRRAATRVRFFENHVYHILTREDIASRGFVDKTISETIGGWNSLYFFACLPSPLSVKTETELEADWIEAVGKAVDVAISEVFDFDSYAFLYRPQAR